MNTHVDAYFTQFDPEQGDGNFHTVVSLHNHPDVSFKDVQKMLPTLPRGWYELAGLEQKDRCEFLRDHWLSKLPYRINCHEAIANFFAGVEDVGVYILQRTFEDPFSAEIVYSLENDRGFFQGKIPANDTLIAEIQSSFEDTILPEDYLAFLRIHDDFKKAGDTGLIPLATLPEVFKSFQTFLEEQSPLMDFKDELINPRSLIPFYESFGQHCYQCFWTQWYPEQEMGNVYYSGQDNSLSIIENPSNWSDSMAFPTFLDWLTFYLERIST